MAGWNIDGPNPHTSQGKAVQCLTEVQSASAPLKVGAMMDDRGSGHKGYFSWPIKPMFL